MSLSLSTTPSPPPPMSAARASRRAALECALVHVQNGIVNDLDRAAIAQALKTLDVLLTTKDKLRMYESVTLSTAERVFRAIPTQWSDTWSILSPEAVRVLLRAYLSYAASVLGFDFVQESDDGHEFIRDKVAAGALAVRALSAASAAQAAAMGADVALARDRHVAFTYALRSGCTDDVRLRDALFHALTCSRGTAALEHVVPIVFISSEIIKLLRAPGSPALMPDAPLCDAPWYGEALSSATANCVATMMNAAPDARKKFKGYGAAFTIETDRTGACVLSPSFEVRARRRALEFVASEMCVDYFDTPSRLLSDFWTRTSIPKTYFQSAASGHASCVETITEHVFLPLARHACAPSWDALLRTHHVWYVLATLLRRSQDTLRAAGIEIVETLTMFTTIKVDVTSVPTTYLQSVFCAALKHPDACEAAVRLARWCVAHDANANANAGSSANANTLRNIGVQFDL